MTRRRALRAQGSDGSGGSESTDTALTQAPREVMEHLAVHFREVLGMTNACVPSALLLAELLAQQGTPAVLTKGYLVIEPEGAGADVPTSAVAHLWVQAGSPAAAAGTAEGTPARSDNSADGGEVLDIGLHLLGGNQKLPPGMSVYLSSKVPEGALRVDAGDQELAAIAAAAEAFMEKVHHASRSSAGALKEVTESYWAGAPPPLQQFRSYMLQATAN